jgi:RimJ/RimL family protein N-acetyltransferase
MVKRSRKTNGSDAPITVTYGSYLLDFDMATIPKAFLWFWRYVVSDGERLNDRQALNLFTILMLFRDGLQLCDLPTTTKRNTLKKDRAQWKRMGILFTHREYFSYAEMRAHFGSNLPPHPEIKHVVYDLTNLAYNIELIAQEWSRRNLELLVEWEHNGKKGHKPVYQFPDDYEHNVVLCPEVAQRIVSGVYDRGEAREYPDGEEKGWWIPPKWWEQAHRMVQSSSERQDRTEERTRQEIPGTGSVPGKKHLVQETCTKQKIPGTEPVPGKKCAVTYKEKEEKEEEEEDIANPISSILQTFAECKSSEEPNRTAEYQFSERERTQVQELLNEGYALEQITEMIEHAFANRRPDAKPIRQFGFMLSYIRHRIQPTGVQPTEAQSTEAPGHADGQPTGAQLTGAQPTGAQSAIDADDPLAQVYMLLQAAEHNGVCYDIPAIRLGLRHFLRGDDPFSADEVHEAAMAAVVRSIPPERLVGYAKVVLHDKRKEATERERLRQAAETVTRTGVPSLNRPDQPLLYGDQDDSESSTGKEAEEKWRTALGELELQMTKATFATWVKPLMAISLEDDTLTLGAPNGYIQDWVEHRLHTPIVRTMSGIMGCQIKLVVTVGEEGGVLNMPELS